MRKVALFSIYLYFFTCPLEFIFNVYIGSSVKYVGLLTSLMIIVYFLGNYKEKIHIGAAQVCLVAWGIMNIFSILWTIKSSKTIDRLMTYLMMDLLLILLSIFPFKKDEFKNLFLSYSLGAFILAVMLMTVGEMDSGYNYAGRLTIKISEAYLDPNNLAAILLVAVVFSFDYIFKKSKITPFSNIISAIVFAVSTITLFMTGSRGGLVGFVVGFTVYILVKAKPKRKALALVLIFIGLVGSYFILKNFLSERLFERLFDFSKYHGGSGRIKTWGIAAAKLVEKPMFGLGTASYLGFFKEIYGGEAAMHNTFLAVLFEVGIVGFSLFISPIIMGLRYAYKYKNSMLFAFIASIMAVAFFLDTLHVRFFWNAMALGIIWHEIYIKDEIKSEQEDTGEISEALVENSSEII